METLERTKKDFKDLRRNIYELMHRLPESFFVEKKEFLTTISGIVERIDKDFQNFVVDNGPPPIPAPKVNTRKPLEDHEIDWRNFVLAGNATITLKDKESGQHFTYKIRKKEEEGKWPIWFTSLLNGPDNWQNYQYFGHFLSNQNNAPVYCHGKKSKISENAPSMIAWREFIKDYKPESFEVFHAGKCARCGRKLTTPQSIIQGYGPECINLI